MMKLDTNGIITKGEIKFWMGLGFVIVTSAVAFNTVRMEVTALQDEYTEIRNDIKEIKKNQVKIMVNMGIDPVDH